MTRIETEVRVPTGVVQFGDDWPGVFIRGDEAMAIAKKLAWLHLKGIEEFDFIDSLAQLLLSCRVEKIA